jgi:hypothetical protein
MARQAQRRIADDRLILAPSMAACPGHTLAPGQMTASIDLRKSHLSRSYGDIVVVFSWINDERALFLIPRFRARAPWFVVMEPAAHEWNDQDPTMLMMVISRAVKACDVLGIEPTPRNARRIIGIVNDAIPELVRMPSSPPPEYARGSLGSLIIRANGEEIGGEEIRQEMTGATYG